MPTLGKKLQDDLTEQWFMDSLVKQLQQVIPFKFQTMEIKFAPLQTVHLSRTFKLLPRLESSSADIPRPSANHSVSGVMKAYTGIDKIIIIMMMKQTKTVILSKDEWM